MPPSHTTMPAFDASAASSRAPSGAFQAAFPWLFILCCGLSLVPVWIVTYPPMVDLPQHAGQVAIWHAWGEGGFDYSQHLRKNWLTPYLLANTLAYVLSWVVPVVTAFKIVISLALLGLPLATLALLRWTGGSRWWVFLTFPTAYGFSFYMGFVAFLLAVPLALYSHLVFWREAQNPTRRGAWLVFGCLLVLFVSHTVAFGWAGLVGASLAATRASGWRDGIRRLMPYLAAFLVAIAWVLTMLATEPATRGGGAGGVLIAIRLQELGALLLGRLDATDLWALVGFLLLGAPFAFGARPSRRLERWIPFGITLALYLSFPAEFFGTALLHPRFPVFLLPTLLCALDRPSRTLPTRIGAVVFVTVALAWSWQQISVFRAYEEETGALHSLLQDMPPHARMLYLPLERSSRHVDYPVYLHSGVWYQVERGGLVDFSFAKYFPNRFRYLPERMPPVPSSIGWRPQSLDWEEHDGHLYDFVLLRGGTDITTSFVRRLGAPLVPIARAKGDWWVFAPRQRRPVE